MTLGQGCRRRTPWWCWGTMLLVTAIALPGAALQFQRHEPEGQGDDDSRPDAIVSLAISPAATKSSSGG